MRFKNPPYLTYVGRVLPARTGDGLGRSMMPRNTRHSLGGSEGCYWCNVPQPTSCVGEEKLPTPTAGIYRACPYALLPSWTAICEWGPPNPLGNRPSHPELCCALSIRLSAPFPLPRHVSCIHAPPRALPAGCLGSILLLLRHGCFWYGGKRRSGT